MTDIEGFLTIYGHSDNLLNNKMRYWAVSMGGGVGENLLVLVRRKMFHTSNKHQPNWLKLARYSYCIISYPNVLSDLRFLVSMATGISHILLGYENMWFFAYKIKFIYLTRVRFLGSADFSEVPPKAF